MFQAGSSSFAFWEVVGVVGKGIETSYPRCYRELAMLLHVDCSSTGIKTVINSVMDSISRQNSYAVFHIAVAY
jgi:hypothetical protein